jgi:oxalate decarboxylase
MRLVSVKEFPASTTMAGALMTIEPGALRALHWHPNADEWQYYIAGRARMTVFGASGRSEVVAFGPGDVGYVPQGYGHYIENAGADPCEILFGFNSGEYEDSGLASWMAGNPTQLVATNFGLPEDVITRFHRNAFLVKG